jgi:hypothetical protein
MGSVWLKRCSCATKPAKDLIAKLIATLLPKAPTGKCV